MSPFVFPDHLEEGMRASTICSVVSGDSPITIKWFKDGRDIQKEAIDSIQIVSITEFVSSLIIDRLDRSFSGNYTCKASSQVGSVNFTTSMLVRARPIWLLKPSSVTVVTGSSARLDCLANGHPSPIIRWKVVRKDISFVNSLPFGQTSSNGSSSSSSSSSITILSSPRIHVLENGSLVIKSVQTEDAGRYLCEASNGVGKSIETSADVQVYEPPTVQVDSQVTVHKGKRIELTCRARGSHPLIFQWYKNDQLIKPDDGHYSTHEEESHPLASPPAASSNLQRVSQLANYIHRERLSVLTIILTTRNDSGIFHCQVSNNYGLDKGPITLLVQEPPDPPVDLRVLEISSRSVSLSWSISYNGNSGITGYELVHKSTHGNGHSLLISVPFVSLLS